MTSYPLTQDSRSAIVDYPWIRVIRVTFDGVRGDAESRSYVSDGSTNTLRIDAQIEKTIAEMPAATQITMYNLMAESRQMFQRNETVVTIEAGWQNQGLSVLFKGNLLNAVSSRHGPDIVTVIHAAAAHELLVTTPIHQTWRSVEVEAVVRQLAGQMEGVAVGVIRDIRGTIGRRGYTVAVTIGNVLNGLARQYGFSWTIDSGQFRAIGDATSTSKLTVIKSPYLISAQPILAGAQQWRRGVSVKATLLPALMPGDVFRVDSTVDAQNGGEYIANRIIHELSAHEPQSHITSVVGFNRRALAV